MRTRTATHRVWVVAVLILQLASGSPTCFAEPDDSTEVMRVFVGDKLVTLREKIGGQKFVDDELRRRLIDRSKGFNAVVFTVRLKKGAAESIEVWGVPTGQIEPNKVRVLTPKSEDFPLIKKHLQLPD